MSDRLNINLERRIDLQRTSMIWERLWTALHWPLLAAGLIIIVLTSGLYQLFPQSFRIVALIVMALGFLVSLRNLVTLALPDTRAAMRRMEQEAELLHRPVSAKDEAVVPELQSSETRALWDEHRRRQLAKLDHVPISPPRSAWRSFDPRALRIPVMLGVAASLLLGPGLFAPNLSDALPVAGAPAGSTLAVDAWLKPPAYTGKAPILLTSPAMKEKLATGAEVLVPENAVLSLRVNGATEPRIEFHALGAVSATSELKDITAKTKTGAGGFTAEAKLSRPSVIRVMDGDTEIASWPVSVVPDQPPTITFPKEYETEIGGGLTLHWEAKDDYGVRSIKSEIALADEQADGIGFESDGPFLYDAPEFPVTLKRSNTKSETGKSTHELAAHPWAGLNITLTLTAKDGGGNTTESKPLTLALPERVFTRPLAKALIEQRKRLILVPDRASEIAGLFDLVLEYPKGLIERSGHHIRLAAIASHLANSGTNDDIKIAVADLWQLAVDVEDGSLSDAKVELAELKKQLEEAMRNGASEEEIAKLMEKMRDAMQRYMDAMRKEAQKNQQAGKQQQGDENSMSVTQEDLQRMMDMIEKLNKEGQKDQAQALLDQLDRMLQNMQPGEGQQQAGEGNQMGEMLDQLQEMMRQQQRLMDETQRMQQGQGQNGQQGEGQQGEQGSEGQMGENGQGNEPGSRGSGLADRQGALGDMLDQMMRELGQNAPGSLGDAGREMRGAQGSLGDEDREGALEQQGNALEQLRKGAGDLRRQMQQGQGQARSRGREGGSAGDDDPLGRPRATRQEDRGPKDDIVPSELAAKRAREILEQLRGRANEQGLTDAERGYIDRLLRGLY